MKLLTMFLNLLNTQADTSAVTESVKPELFFEPGNFVDAAAAYMGKGMLVIFVLIGIIVLITIAINKIFSNKK